MLMLFNLNLMTTRNCNFCCRHCMRGDSADENISDEVLNKIFKRGTIIQHLQLNGGEVLSRPDVLAKVINAIIKNGVIVSIFTIVTNGTLFTPEIEALLDSLNVYIKFCNGSIANFIPTPVRLELSNDQYHMEEMQRIKRENPQLFTKYMTNINRLIKSKYFAGLRETPYLIDSGRAKNLNVDKKPPLCAPILYTEVKDSIEKAIIVSLLGVDVNGTICNTCGEMPPKLDSVYGNILHEELTNILKRVGTRCVSEEDLICKYRSELVTLNNMNYISM